MSDLSDADSEGVNHPVGDMFNLPGQQWHRFAVYMLSYLIAHGQDEAKDDEWLDRFVGLDLKTLVNIVSGALSDKGDDPEKCAQAITRKIRARPQANRYCDEWCDATANEEDERKRYSSCKGFPGKDLPWYKNRGHVTVELSDRFR